MNERYASEAQALIANRVLSRLTDEQRKAMELEIRNDIEAGFVYYDACMQTRERQLHPLKAR